MTGVVLSFPSGEVIDHPDEPCLDYPQELFDEAPPVSLADEEQTKNILDRIEKLRHLALAGRLDGLILIASDPVTGYFLTELCLSEEQGRSDLFGFVGVLETLKAEITEKATMSPCMTMDGEILDPFTAEEAK